jgi:hypothetical protein
MEESVGRNSGRQVDSRYKNHKEGISKILDAF